VCLGSCKAVILCIIFFTYIYRKMGNNVFFPAVLYLNKEMMHIFYIHWLVAIKYACTVKHIKHPSTVLLSF